MGAVAYIRGFEQPVVCGFTLHAEIPWVRVVSREIRIESKDVRGWRQQNSTRRIPYLCPGEQPANQVGDVWIGSERGIDHERRRKLKRREFRSARLPVED